MVDMAPDDPPELPVERLAQFLLGCAREDPTLLARSNIDPIGRRGAAPRARLGKPIPLAKAPPLPLMLAAARKDPELEELVSIAVACARRAEDALQHARDVSAMARRRMSMVAAVTGAGIMVAATAVVLGRPMAPADPRLTEATIPTQTTPQQVAMRSEAAPRDTTAATPDAPPAAPVQTAAADTGLAGPPPPDKAPMAAASHEPVPSTAPVMQAAAAPAAVMAPALDVTQKPMPPPMAKSVVTPASLAELRNPPVPPKLSPHRDAWAGKRHRTEALAAETRQRDPVTPALEPDRTGVPDSLPPPDQVAQAPDMPDPTGPAASDDGARPVAPAHPVVRYYQRRVWHETHYAYWPNRRVIYLPAPPVILSHVVADVRRNLYDIFH